MKVKQTTIFILAAVLIASTLFAFKAADEPAKEYATIQFRETTKKDAIIVTANGESKMTSTETMYDEKKFLEILNGMASEGWKIRYTDYTSTGAFTNRVVYLEKIKQQ